MRNLGAGTIDQRLKLFSGQPVADCDEAALRVPQRGWAALLLLLEAYRYARDLERSRWDFAVEIQELRQTGCGNSEFRWMVCKGIVESAREIQSTDEQERRFESRGSLVFDKRSCFVLTDTGAALVRDLSPQRSERDGRMPLWPGAGRITPECPTAPEWDRDRQELRWGTLIVKQYKVPAANQEKILAAFEEERWPVRIDDPLPPHPDRASKRRLHDTINALNRNQKHSLIRFCGDGKGEGVRWKLVRRNGISRLFRQTSGDVGQ